MGNKTVSGAIVSGYVMLMFQHIYALRKERGLMGLRKDNNVVNPKIDSIFPKDLIDNYPNEVVLLYSKGLENRQIGKRYFLLREAVKKNGIYATNDRTRLNSIKKYSQSLDFYKDEEFYFDRSNTTMFVSDFVIGKRFMGKLYF